MNNAQISVVVSKDRENFSAINKVSDNLTVLNTFVPAGKNEDGSYKKPANLTIRLTSKSDVKGEITQGSHLDVEGFFVTNTYTNKEGKEIATLQIVARKVTVKDKATAEEVAEVAEAVDAIADEVPFR